MMEELPICSFHLVPHFEECSSGVKYQHFCFLANFCTLGGPQREKVCVCVCFEQIYSWSVILIKFFCFGQISPTF
jgi:hypothetical protein